MQYRLLRNRKETSSFSEAFRSFLHAVDNQFKPRLSKRDPGIEGKVKDFINANSIIALEGKDIVGAVVFFPDYRGTKKPYIDFVARHPSVRATGLGGKLLGRAIVHLQQQGKAPITVSTYGNNKAVLALYKRFGFRVVDVEKNARGAGVDRLHLERAVAGKSQPKPLVLMQKRPKRPRAHAYAGNALLRPSKRRISRQRPRI